MEKMKKDITIDQLIKEISDVMPKLQIYKCDVLHPTPDCVYRFYMHFWSQLEERLNELKFEEDPEFFNTQDLDPFEEIFLKMSLILKEQVYFTLEDIYEPQTFRTKLLFKLCVHFLVFIDNVDDDVKQNFKSLTDIFDKISFAPRENEKLLSKIEDNASILSILKDENQKLHQNYTDTLHLHEELEEQKTRRESLHNAKLKEANNLKNELNTKNSHLNQLKNQETNLSEQIVIPDEYENLLAKLEISEKEISSVHNTRIEYENYTKKIHARFCKHQEALQLISNYLKIDVPSLSSLVDNEQQLKNVTIQNDGMSKHLETLKEKKEHYLEIEKELETIRRGYMDKVKETLNNTIIQLETELKCLQSDLEQKQHSKNKSLNQLKVIAQALTRLNQTIVARYSYVIDVAQGAMKGFD